MKKEIIIGVIVLVFLAAFAYTYYMFNKPERDVTDEKGIAISASAIYDSFINHESQANEAFLNKAIKVTGEVSGIKENQSGKKVVYLKTEDPVFGINCTFKENPENIEVGDTITFKGICTGYLSDVVINDGVLMD